MRCFCACRTRTLLVALGAVVAIVTIVASAVVVFNRVVNKFVEAERSRALSTAHTGRARIRQALRPSGRRACQW
jgi:hypothetical protein